MIINLNQGYKLFTNKSSWRSIYLGLLIICLSLHWFSLLSYSYSSNISVEVNSLGQIESLDLTVLTDNYPDGDLMSEWGVSMLVETNNLTILFDTGLSYNVLKHNSQVLGKNLSLVDYVVISHEHRDHTGGLSYIAEVNPNVTVYIPSHMSSIDYNFISELDLNIIRIRETTIVQSGFAIIGELFGLPYEQALAANVKDIGLVILVGCSHPGVEDIVEKAVIDLECDPYMVIGGFHMVDATEQEMSDTIEKLIDLNIKKIYPIHCSGDRIREYLKNNYPQHYGEGCVGFQKTINIDTVTDENTISTPLNIFFILIPLIILSLGVIVGLFIWKKFLRK